MSKPYTIREDDEVRVIPINRTTDQPRTPEQEELFHKIIHSMREAGRKAKEGDRK